LLDGSSSDITGAMAADVGDELDVLYASARAAWPGVDVSLDRFTEFVLEKLAGDVSPSSLATSDLYLACACCDGDPHALATFDRELAPEIVRAVLASGVTPAERTELVQVVRTRLLVAPAHETPRIATFSGRGSLKAWLRVVATREAARLLASARREQPVGDDEALADAVAPDAGPALAFMKATYREEFKRAFHAAVAALTDRERLLLRQAELDGLSIDELAEFYGVHRATAARWVQAARASVLEGTRGQLAASLGIPSEEVASIMRLIRSNLDITLPALLREARVVGRAPRKRR